MTVAPKRRLTLAAVFVIASLAVTGAMASTALAAGPFPLPPNGVYTCSWIADNPSAAAAAQVTCDPSTFFAAVETPAPAASQTLPPSGCQPVPTNGGRVGTGVYAWGDYFDVTSFSFYAQWGDPWYTWYVPTENGTNWLNGTELDNSTHYANNLPLQYYRWGAQNHGDIDQSWEVCP